MSAVGRKLHSLNLGGGMLGTFAWQHGVDRDKGIPSGIVIGHGDTYSPHCLTALWAMPLDATPEVAASNALVALESLRPLTITDELVCPACGLRGRIVEDRWVHA